MRILAAVVVAAIPGGAGAQETWCWKAQADAPRACVYTLVQCHEIVRLRHAGICVRAGGSTPRFTAEVQS